MNQNKKWFRILYHHNNLKEMILRMNCILLTSISNHTKTISKNISNKSVKLLNAKSFIKTDVPKEKLLLNT